MGGTSRRFSTSRKQARKLQEAGLPCFGQADLATHTEEIFELRATDGRVLYVGVGSARAFARAGTGTGPGPGTPPPPA